MAKRWTKGEEKALRRYSSKMSIQELAKKFGVTPGEVRKKEKSLGIIREHTPRKKVRRKAPPSSTRKWTEREAQYLKNHFEKMTNAQMAKKFKTTAKSVESKLRRMGLRRERKSAVIPEEERKRKIGEILKEMRRRLEEERAGENHRGEAIARFDQAVQLYHTKKYERAESAFGKIIKDFGNVIDIVRKARQYIKLCQETS
ncbi:hypothetical protein KAU86_05435 [bacterium]|nr:hypothetical protein [bacterium]